MKKIFLSIIALLMSAGLWAQIYDVEYIDANGVEQYADEVEVIDDDITPLTWGSDRETTWYYLEGPDIVTLSAGATCQGDVRLILGDGAKLTITGGVEHAGIQVSGEGNSLTIYGQAAQSGQLIVTGSYESAGIGGGKNGSGSNITINGGIVTVNGGDYGAGIGGGYNGSGSNITINGGKVTANGGSYAAGIGGGFYGSGSNITINSWNVVANGGERTSGIGGGAARSGSNIIVAANLLVKADNYYNPPTTIIPNDGGDLAELLKNKRFVTFVVDPLADVKAAAIAEIKAAMDSTFFSAEVEYINTHIGTLLASQSAITGQKESILAYINLHADKVAVIKEIEDELGYLAEFEMVRNYIGYLAIEAAENIEEITNLKNTAFSKMKEVNSIFDDVYTQGDSIGYARGKAEALGSMAEPCENCTAVEVKKGDKVVTLYAPDQVIYKKEE